MALRVSSLFRALAKPAMIMGVHYDFCFLETMLVMLVFIYSDHLWTLLLIFPLHVVGWVLCRIDPFIFRLLSIRATIGRSSNFTLWQCQSYGPH